MEIDTTKPHIGRIYDYMLGGHHNFDVDRQAAKRLMEVVPSYPKWARLNRWFLQLIADQWAAEGRTRVLDLGSGLPTQGHFHESMLQARIIYSDSDPLSVAYGQQLLENETNAEYVFADLRDPQPLFDQASAFFGDERTVAVGLIGVGYFLDDAQLARLAQMLHDWCEPGSVMALTYMQTSDRPEHQAKLTEISQRFATTGVLLHSRSLDQVQALMKPWQIVLSQPLDQWLAIDALSTNAPSDEDLGGLSGTLLVY